MTNDVSRQMRINRLLIGMIVAIALALASAKIIYKIVSSPYVGDLMHLFVVAGIASLVIAMLVLASWIGNENRKRSQGGQSRATDA